MPFVNLYDCMCASFHFGVEGGIWDSIALVPGSYCLHFSLYINMCHKFAAQRDAPLYVRDWHCDCSIILSAEPNLTLLSQDDNDGPVSLL